MPSIIAVLARANDDCDSLDVPTMNAIGFSFLGVIGGIIVFVILVSLAVCIAGRIKKSRKEKAEQLALRNTQPPFCISSSFYSSAATVADADVTTDLERTARYPHISAKKLSTTMDLARTRLSNSVRPPAVTVGLGPHHREQALNLDLERTDSQIAHAPGSPRILVQQEWSVTAVSSPMVGMGLGADEPDVDTDRDVEMFELHRCVGPSSLRAPPVYEEPAEPLPAYVAVVGDRRAGGRSGGAHGSTMAPAA